MLLESPVEGRGRAVSEPEGDFRNGIGSNKEEMPGGFQALLLEIGGRRGPVCRLEFPYESRLAEGAGPGEFLEARLPFRPAEQLESRVEDPFRVAARDPETDVGHLLLVEADELVKEALLGKEKGGVVFLQ